MNMVDKTINTIPRVGLSSRTFSYLISVYSRKELSFISVGLIGSRIDEDEELLYLIELASSGTS